MIEYRDSVFALNGDGWSHLFRVTEAGLLENLHFGAPVALEDAEALRCKPGLGWGAAILPEEEDPASCPDTLPLLWSDSGRGDYRESPLVLSDSAGPMPGGFRYACHRVVKGTMPVLGLPCAQQGEQTLEITMERPGSGLCLRLYWTVFPDALTRRAVLENNGKQPVAVERLMSQCIDLVGRYEMTTLDGGWIGETHAHRVPVGEARVVNESLTGFSSNRHNPGFLLSSPGATETAGEVYGFNLVYSGGHYAGVQRSMQGLTRVVQGLSPAGLRVVLQPGERFETPEAVMAWSGEGYGGLSARMHRFVNRHIVPPAWRERPRPVLYNSWEGCMFDFNEGRLLDLARRAKKLGCELFVLDDGWFGRRNDDRAGLGDYHVNRRKLPGGIGGLAKKIRGMGLQFGLWFEPEAVNPDSDLYRAHPDWALTDDLAPLTGRHELLLDLTKSAVRDYLVESVCRVLDSADISYVKWDMNRHSCALGLRSHEYIRGLYEVLGRIFGPRPHILLETCASGGNRFDLGMLCFSPQIWCSDNTDPIERLDIQGGLSYLYPLSTMGAHVSAAPHSQTLRQTPLSTRGNAAFFGVLGYELDLRHLLPVEQAEIAAQIAYYKERREVFQFGLFRRLPTEEEGTVAWQVSRGDRHLVGLFHRLIPAAPGYQRLRAVGLAPGQRYQVDSRPQTLRVGQFGGLLRHVVPVSINPNGALLRAADRHYRMMDGGQSFSASGGALMVGWMLAPRFSGTGYRGDLRVQGDFGSQLFEIREELQK